MEQGDPQGIKRAAHTTTQLPKPAQGWCQGTGGSHAACNEPASPGGIHHHPPHQLLAPSSDHRQGQSEWFRSLHYKTNGTQQPSLTAREACSVQGLPASPTPHTWGGPSTLCFSGSLLSNALPKAITSMSWSQSVQAAVSGGSRRRNRASLIVLSKGKRDSPLNSSARQGRKHLQPPRPRLHLPMESRGHLHTAQVPPVLQKHDPQHPARI